jgi:hypothetical protein
MSSKNRLKIVPWFIRCHTRRSLENKSSLAGNIPFLIGHRLRAGASDFDKAMS